MNKKTLVVATLFAGALIVTPLADATAATTKDIQSLDVKSYHENLSHAAEKDSKAKQILNQFDHLSHDKQQKFVEYLQDLTITQALIQTQTEGKENVTVLRGGDVVIKTLVSTQPTNSLNGVSVNAVSSQDRASITSTTDLFGVTVTELGTYLVYTHDYNHVISCDDAGNWQNNYNFMVDISGSTGKGYNPSYAWANTIWAGKVSYSLGSIKISKEQDLWANYFGDAGGSIYNL